MLDKLLKLLILPLALCLVSFQRFLSPVLMIRLTFIDFSRIGNLYPLYWYDLIGRDRRGNKKLTIDILFAAPKIANKVWFELFASKFHLFEYNIFFSTIYGLNQRLPGSSHFKLDLIRRDRFYEDSSLLKKILNCQIPYFSLRNDQLEKGKKILLQMGVPENAPFICFHNRDSAYLDQTYPDKNWTYHDYRDSDIKNYLKAAEYLTSKGYYAIRIGSKVKEPVQSENKMIIDYSQSSFQSDLMDVYLGSQCKLLLCSDTGMSIFSELFRVPIVYVNWTLLPRVSNWVDNAIFIPKRLYSQKKGKELNFTELLSDIRLRNASSTNYFTENKIEFIENTPDEILLATIEMLDRINNRWPETPEASQLQIEYWKKSVFIPEDQRSKNFRIATSYLQNNLHLLKE